MEVREREGGNWQQSTRKSDREKMAQLYLNDPKGRFPDSIEELAKAFSRPLPPLPAGSFLYIDRTNKVVRRRACFKARPVRAPGLQAAGTAARSCRPRGLTRLGAGRGGDGGVPTIVAGKDSTRGCDPKLVLTPTFPSFSFCITARMCFLGAHESTDSRRRLRHAPVSPHTHPTQAAAPRRRPADDRLRAR